LIAAQVAAASEVPIISPVSVTPTLSDGSAYPYFLRTTPSSQFTSTVMIDILLGLWNYTSVAFVYSSDAFGSGHYAGFLLAAFDYGLNVVAHHTFSTDNSDLVALDLRASLLNSLVRVIVIFSQPTDGSHFLRTAYENGVGGEGYLWFGSDSLVDSGLWESDSEMASNIALRERVLRGFFSVAPNVQQSAMYQGYLARRKQLPPIGNDASCNMAMDDDGNFLWAQDHDDNASTPRACALFNISKDGPYDTFGYDSVMAIVHALHDLVEVQNRTEIIGDELLDTLIKHVRFEGLTGLVDFYDASADPEKMYHGDRRVGFSYNLYNYVDNARGLVVVGTWTSCSNSSYEQAGQRDVSLLCVWSERWQETPGVTPTYSTADDRPPVNSGGKVCSGNEVLTKGQCVCDDGHERDPILGDCRRCNVGQDSLAASGSEQCDMCAEGYYRLSADPADHCTSCDRIGGVTCPLNATLEKLNLHEGHWRISATSLEVHKCWTPSNSRLSPCKGGSNSDFESAGYCREGHNGPRCELCSNSSQYYSQGVCLDCPEASSRLLAFAFISLALLAFLVGVYAASLRLAPRLYYHGKQWVRRCYARCMRLALIAKLKLAFAFFQTMSLLPTVYDTDLPEYFYSWTRFVNVFKIPLDQIVIARECLGGGFEGWLLFSALLPFGAMAVYLGISLPIEISQDIARRLLSGTKECPQWKTRLFRLLPMLLFVAFCLTPSTSNAIFSAWNCESFQLDSTSNPPLTVRFLRGDLSVKCDESDAQYKSITNIALILVLIWPIGVPLGFLLLLVSCRKALLLGQSTRMSQAISFLHREYVNADYWWEFLFLLHRLAIVGFVQLVPNPIQRCLFGILVALAYLIALFAFKPYKRNDVGSTAYGSQITTLLLVFFMFLLRQFEFLEEVDEAELTLRVIGYDSVEGMVSVMIIAVFAFLGLFVVLVLYHVLTNPNIQYLLLVDSGEQPSLSLETGKRWHLFLSHIWSSGQDQVANIKRKLQLMLNGCQIFLDVDDLENTEDLEQYVKSSENVLVFLSKGYFFSANCLRELDCALSIQAPLILVHEKNLDKGGVSLDTLRTEVVSQGRDAECLFHAGQEIVIWYRVEHFQLLSLKRIAQSMLYATPLYKNLDMPPVLYLPGEITPELLHFRNPVCLFVSRFNSGAAALADELVACYTDEDIEIVHLCPSTTKDVAQRGLMQANSLIVRCSDMVKTTSSQAMGSVTSHMAKARTTVEEAITHNTKRSYRHPRRRVSLRDAIRRTTNALSKYTRPDTITRMLLYLNQRTFVGDSAGALAEEVRLARARGIKIVLVHENDDCRDGCPFSRLFETTPYDLIREGVYKELAVQFHPMPYRTVSLALLAKALEAKRYSNSCKLLRNAIPPNALPHGQPRAPCQGT